MLLPTCPTTLFKTTTGVGQSVALSVDIHHQLTWKKKGTQLQRGENTCVNKPLVKKQDFGMHTCIAAYFLSPGDIRVTEEDTDGTYAWGGGWGGVGATRFIHKPHTKWTKFAKAIQLCRK